jgi:hypothetical protein
VKTAAQRFWPKVQGGDVTTCWIWTASRTRSGYGRFSISAGKWMTAHRWAYEALIAPVPDGLDLDHLCRTRACINPWHLDPVTRKVNLSRGDHWWNGKTHCAHGHELTEANAYRTPDGHRECRVCRLAATRRHAPKKREYMRRYRSANQTS